METYKFGLRYCSRKHGYFFNGFSVEITRTIDYKDIDHKEIYSENYSQLVLTHENFRVFLFEISNET